jgi:hypothetical protein
MGKVEPDGVDLHDGNLAGVGDRVVTRLNDSRNRDNDDRQVANRDHWIVRGRDSRGQLTVERLDDATGQPTGLQVDLAPAYVAGHIELAYAAVKDARQGATVDTSHSLIDERSDLAGVYVPATRGRHHNTLYVETHRAGAPENQALADTPEAVLGRILDTGRRSRPVSAHQAIRDAQNGATSLATLGPIWDDNVAMAARHEVAAALRAAAGESIAQAAQNDPAWPTRLAAARAARETGWDLDVLLTAAVTERELDSADGVAKVLVWRLQRITDELSDAFPDRPVDTSEPVAWPSYVERTPPGDDPDLIVARQAAEFLDARVETLRQQLADDPPAWSTRVLGPVPDDPADRDDWTRRAAAVAAYRERYSITGDPAGDIATQLLGPRPQAGRGEATTLWEHANTALGEASELNRLRAASDEELRAAMADARRAQADRPPYAGDELRAAALALRRAQAADAALHTQVEQAVGQRGRLSRWRSGSAATHSALDAELTALTATLQNRATVTAAAQTRYESARAGDARWQEWDRHTAAARRTGRLAAALLAARTSPGTPPPAGSTARSRLAGLADAERQAAERTAARVREATSTRAEKERIWREDQARVLREPPTRNGPDRGPDR